MRLVREAWPRRAKRGIEQDSIVDYAGGIDSGFRTLPKSKDHLRVMVIGLFRANRDTHKTAKGVVSRVRLQFNLARAINLTNVVDVRVRFDDLANVHLVLPPPQLERVSVFMHYSIFICYTDIRFKEMSTGTPTTMSATSPPSIP